MSDPSTPEGNEANEVQSSSDATTPELEEPVAAELSAEELDEVSGAGLVYLSTGTSTTTVTGSPPPPPRTPPPPQPGS